MEPPTTTAAATSRPNGLRASNQLVVSREGRKPLFTAGHNARDKAAGARTNGAAPSPPCVKPGRLAVEVSSRAASGLGLELARRTKSASQPSRKSISHGDADSSDHHSNSSSNSAGRASPGGTRIPRPASSTFHRRRPISLAEAFRLAEDEESRAKCVEALDGSPSPAPRSWRARGESRQMLDRRRPDAKTAAGELAGDSLAKPIDRSSTTAPAQQEPNWESRASSDRRPDPASPPAEHHGISDGHDVPDLVPGIEDVPLPSVEAADRESSRSPRRNKPVASPEKAFAWQVEADFTAGDLQFSDSPRIRVESNRPFANRPSLVSGGGGGSPSRSPPRLTHPGSSNTKLDEIRARELKPTSQILAGKSLSRPGNSKLDEIRAREKAAEAQIPIPDRNQPRPKNTKLDEIRQREAEGLSKRAYASARLEEIREQNSTSRSVSPDEARPRSGKQEQQRLDQRKAAPEGSQDKKTAARGGSAPESAGERIPDTPITVFKNRRAAEREAGVDDEATDRRDSHSLLRRLARATSASPAPEADASRRRPPSPRHETNGDEPRPKPSALVRSPDKGKKTQAGGGVSKDRPTVGFTGLRRSESVDLAKNKRSSVQSEADPTDRIEAEILLFAPHDNQSERGSVRAPSPPSSSDDELAQATPKAERHDFAGMPTPKVTGAYVETPATARPERRSDGAATVFADDRAGLGWRKRDQDTASDPGTSDHNRDGDAVSAAAALRRRRRARSLPRRRPLLRNSAKLPSVRGDLLELQRIHNIDDSTTDDVEDMLLGRKRGQGPDELDEDGGGGSDGKQTVVKHEDGDETDGGELKADGSDRMSRLLYAGLRNIRTAKQGISRLEDRFSHASTRPESASGDDKKAALGEEAKADAQKKAAGLGEPCAACAGQPSAEALTYIHVPVPRLYHTTPRLRLSLAGLLLAAVSLWLALEGAMCARYCRPATCASGDCVFSFDDPTPGTALPVKLDQWATGGCGRALAAWAADQAQDLAADLEDLALGRSMADVPLGGMTATQKRRHRRRLARRGLRAASTAPPPPEQRAKWEAWRRARLAQDRAREVREMGYHEAGDGGEGDEGAAIGGDERVG